MRAFLSHLQTLSRFSLFAVYINQHIRVSVEYLPQALCNLTIYAWLANLYLRLSKEDKRSANAESISIETQRMKTTNFAKQNSIIIRKEFVDEHVIIGTSGENLVKSRGSALVPFSFLLRDKPKSFKSLKIISERL